MRKYLKVLLAVAVIVAGVQVCAFAEKGYDHKGMSFKDNFFKKVGVIYQNKEDLNITDEQMAKIKEIKVSLKKDLVMKDAEIEVVGIDIKGLMYEDTPDAEAVNALIDKKYEMKKEKTKKIIASCFALKDVLSDKQKEQVKAMMKEKTKQCPMMRDKREMMGNMMMHKK